MATKKKSKKKPEPPQQFHHHVISNCEFNVVKWDAKALASIEAVAQALLNLTVLFRAQDIKVDTMIKFEAGNTAIENGMLRDNSDQSQGKGKK